MKKIVKGIVMIAAGLLMIEVIKETVVYPATDIFDAGMKELWKSKK